MSTLRLKFGKRIKQLRKARGLTQEGLAEKASLEPTYVGAVERGARNLTIDNIEKIAKGFDIETYRLFFFHSDTSNENQVISKEQLVDILENMTDIKRDKIIQIVALMAQLQE